MSRDVYCYSFPPAIPLDEVETTLLLAIWAVEALYGINEVQLDVGYLLDHDRRVCVIDATSEVGSDLNRLFASYLAREFGSVGFRLERVRLACHNSAAV